MTPAALRALGRARLEAAAEAPGWCPVTGRDEYTVALLAAMMYRTAEETTAVPLGYVRFVSCNVWPSAYYQDPLALRRATGLNTPEGPWWEPAP